MRNIPSHRVPSAAFEPVVGVGFVAMVTAALAAVAYGMAALVAMLL